MSIFSSIRINKPGTNKFNMSHDFKFTCDFGKLVPVVCQEILPGDKWKCSSEIFARLMPMQAPLMHNCNVYVHYFFVPNRLLWSKWEDFITKGVTGDVTPSVPMQYVDFGSTTTNMVQIRQSIEKLNGLADYMGLPVDRFKAVENVKSKQAEFSVLPFAAYQLIYNEYFRDETLDPDLDIKSFVDWYSDHPHIEGGYNQLFELRSRAWEKDYFTSALPTPQRGPDVTLPSPSDAEIYVDPTISPKYQQILDSSGQPIRDSQQNLQVNRYGHLSDPSGNDVFLDPNHSMRARMSSVDKLTINDLRWAARLQEWYELGARAGSRYAEQILAHFGVRSPDARLQRPEYLGGGKTPVVIGEVLQTSATDGSSPQGTMAGRGVVAGRSNRCKRFFSEHGWLIGVMSILPRTSYSQGIPKAFSRTSVFDYYFPKFAHLGEQEIKNRELWFDGSPGELTDDGVFGYTPRYAEYKYIPSRIAGDMRQSLNFWHLSRLFSTPPQLDSKFVHVDSNSINRIFADNSSQFGHVIVQCYNKLIARRPMPVFGTPML